MFVNRFTTVTTLRTRPVWQVALSSLTALSLLACSGGGGGNSEPPATATAVADTFTVAWNGEHRLTVLDNDSVSGAAPVLSLAVAPKNGSVSITAGVLSYTPKTGYFGGDEFQYKVEAGSANSTAIVKMVVEAEITLQGLVTTGQTTAATQPMANAKVQASVGSKSFTADADATGRYSLPIKTSNASDFVTLTGIGTGTQSKLVLTSLAGEVAALAAVAKDGKLSSDQAPALLVTHVSAAQAGLMVQMSKLPSSNVELSAAAAKLNQFVVADAAALVGLVAGAGVALPAAVGNTRELLESATQLSSFDAAQRLANATRLTMLREAMVSDPVLAIAPPTPTATNTTPLLYANGQGGAAYAASLITLRADGGATILTDDTARGAKWQLQNKVLQLTYDTPFVVGSGSVDVETFDDVDTGVTYTDLGPSQGSYVLTGSRTIRHRLITNGGRRGQRTDISYGDFTRRYTPNGNAFKVEEFAAGVRIAGPFSGNPGPDAGPVQAQDILRITGPGTGLMERTSAAASWQLVDGALRVDLGSASTRVSARYRRLGLGPLGEERWTMEFLDTAGQATGFVEIMAVRASPVTLTAADWAKPWRGNLQDGIGFNLTYDLKTDGSWVIVSSGRETPQPTSSVKRYWRQLPDGRLDMAGGVRQCNPFASADCVITQQRYWTVVGRSGKTLWVIEEGPYFIDPGAPVEPSFRLVAFTDPSTGP
jgi:hypothetical protein